MENLDLILSAICTVLGFIAVVITFVVKLVKLIRANASAGQCIQLCEMLLPLMQEAEKRPELNGEQKKSYVLDKISEFATENTLKFFDIEFISKKIDELVNLTKNVNFK